VRAIAIGALAAAAACGGAGRARGPCFASAPVPAAAAPETRSLGDLEWETVVSVDVSGQRSLAGETLLAAVRVRRGQPLDPEAIASDIRQLYGLAAFDDVAAEVRRAPGGVAVTYALSERRLVGSARIGGDPPPPLGGRRIGGLAGGTFEPSRLRRAAERLRRSYEHAGHWKAEVELRSRPAKGGVVDVCFQAQAGPRYLIDEIAVAGAELSTHDGAVNVPGAVYRADLLAEDLARLKYDYYDRGMIDVRVDPPRVTIDQRRRRLRIAVDIHPGPVYRLGTIALSGVRAADRTRYRAALRLEPGETFSRTRVFAAIERIVALERAAGRQTTAVTPASEVDTGKRTIDLTIAVSE
jgi:outer membrane protein insertion porin family